MLYLKFTKGNSGKFDIVPYVLCILGHLICRFAPTSVFAYFYVCPLGNIKLHDAIISWSVLKQPVTGVAAQLSARQPNY